MLLGFKPRFVEPILIGTKVFTLRSPRKKEPKIGETLYMYTGLRTNQCKKITDKEKLRSVQIAAISIIRHNDIYTIKIHIDGRRLNAFELGRFVKYDGFKDTKDFADYWLSTSYAPKKAPVNCRVNGSINLYHWTDLRY